MVTVPLNIPTRAQLQRMVGNDPDLLRGVENLFRLAGVDTPADLVDIISAINDVEISIGATNATAITATSIADRLQNIVELLETAPIVQYDSAEAEAKADAAFALASSIAETVEYIETGPVAVQYPVTSGSDLLSGQAIVTVPNARFEHEETIAVAGILPTHRIIVGIGAHIDSDENAADMLDVTGMSATAGTGSILFTLGFSSKTAGPVRINWSAS